MAYCFEKAKTLVVIEGRKKVVRCATLICIKAATIQPAASYFDLSKSSTLKRGMGASHRVSPSPEVAWKRDLRAKVENMVANISI